MMPQFPTRLSSNLPLTGTKYGIIGVGGYIAPKHLKAINETNGSLVVACDISDSVGVLDNFSPDCKFTKSPRKFFKLCLEHVVDTIVICTPSYTHYRFAKKALSMGFDVICEKPLSLKPKHCAKLVNLAKKQKVKLWCVMQMLLSDKVKQAEEWLKTHKKHLRKVEIRYRAYRGEWYSKSWKNSFRKSGGILCNIGIHAIDAICRWFSPVFIDLNVYYGNDRASHGVGHFFIGQRSVPLSWYVTVDAQESAREIIFHSDENIVLDLTTPGGLHTDFYRSVLNGTAPTPEETFRAVDFAISAHNKAQVF